MNEIDDNILSKLKTVSQLSREVKNFLIQTGVHLSQVEGHIMKLAEKGILPHYVVTNPVNGKTSIMFVNNEVRDYLKENCIIFNAGALNEFKSKPWPVVSELRPTDGAETEFLLYFQKVGEYEPHKS